MSNSIKLVLCLGLFGLVAACGQQEEETVFVEPIVTEEPVHTGKYK
ncbi:hypothetical protein [Candidatus Rhodobacter oscarellae]|nr:hypothetical protein [Candidatus Rhodobacter lobularis]